MPRQHATSTGSGGHNAFTQEQSLDFWARRWRDEYLAPQPIAKLDETMARARRVVADHPRSYLARNFARLYGGES